MRKMVAAVFLLLVMGPAGAWLLGARQETFENRAEKTWPVFALTALASAEYFQEAGAFLIERLPLRQLAVDARRHILLDILNEAALGQVIVGANGHLFIRRSMEAWCNHAGTVYHAQQAARVLRESVTNGQRVLWVSVPDKYQLEGAHLPDRFAALAACAGERRGNFAAAMTAALGPDFIDLQPVLRNLQAGGAGALFHREDTHWLAGAALTMPARIIDRLHPELWDDQALVQVRGRQVVSDLALQLGITAARERVHFDARRAAVELIAEKTLPGGRRQPIRSTRYHGSEPGHLIPGRTLLIHDSFMLPVIATLPPYFENLVTVHWEDLTPRRLASLLEGRDRVILESIDRLAPIRLRRVIYRWWRKDVQDR